jgi:hypothetical protein
MTIFSSALNTEETTLQYLRLGYGNISATEVTVYSVSTGGNKAFYKLGNR